MRETAFFIPVQLTFEWPLHARSAVLAAVTAISFPPYSTLQRRYYYAHSSWKTSVLKEGKWLTPEHPGTELKCKLESFGLQVLQLDFFYKTGCQRGFKKFDKWLASEIHSESRLKTRFSNSQSRFFHHMTAPPPKALGFPKRCLDGIPSQQDANRSDPHSSSWVNKISWRAVPILCA